MKIPVGYAFAAASASFKKPGKPDLGAIVSRTPAVAAGVFTTNKFKGRAGPAMQGDAGRRPEDVRLPGQLGPGQRLHRGPGPRQLPRDPEPRGQSPGCPADELLPASTGVIGAQFDMENGPLSCPRLKESLGTAGPDDTARAIMTTDTVHKLAESGFKLKGGEVRLLGMCKGAGMISPNMATMLCFVACDADISAEAWQTMLADCVNLTINGSRWTATCPPTTASWPWPTANRAWPSSPRTTTSCCANTCFPCWRSWPTRSSWTPRAAPRWPLSRFRARRTTRTPKRWPGPWAIRPWSDRAVRLGPQLGPDHLCGGLFRRGFQGRGPGAQNRRRAGLPRRHPGAGRHGRPAGPIMKERDIVIHIDVGDGPGSSMLLASDLTKQYVSINADYRS